MKRLLSIVLAGMVVVLMTGPVAAKSGQAVYDAWKAREKNARGTLDRLYMVQEMEQVEDGAAFTAKVSIWQNGRKQRMEQEILKSDSGFIQPGRKTIMPSMTAAPAQSSIPPWGCSRCKTKWILWIRS